MAFVSRQLAVAEIHQAVREKCLENENVHYKKHILSFINTQLSPSIIEQHK